VCLKALYDFAAFLPQRISGKICGWQRGFRKRRGLFRGVSGWLGGQEVGQQQ